MPRRILPALAAAVLALGAAACGHGGDGPVTTPPPALGSDASDGGGADPDPADRITRHPPPRPRRLPRNGRRDPGRRGAGAPLLHRGCVLGLSDWRHGDFGGPAPKFLRNMLGLR